MAFLGREPQPRTESHPKWTSAGPFRRPSSTRVGAGKSDRQLPTTSAVTTKQSWAMRRECAAGEFPTRTLTQARPRRRGPQEQDFKSMSIAGKGPARASFPQFSREELATVRAGYEPLHRLLFGASTLRPENQHDAEKTPERGVNVNDQNI